MLKKVISGVLITVLSLSFVACGKSAKDEVDKGTISSSDKSTVSKDDKKLDAGAVEGREYKNEFFGMTVKLPDNWVIASDEEKQAILDGGKEVAAGGDENKEKLYDLSLQRTVYLLVTSQKGMSVQDITNPSFMTLAEKLSFFQGVKDGKGYLEEVKKQLKALAAQIPYNLDKDIYTERIGGKDFYVLEAVVNGTGVTLKQKYYASVMNSYALSFITTSYSDEQSESLDEIVKTISFE